MPRLCSSLALTWGVPRPTSVATLGTLNTCLSRPLRVSRSRRRSWTSTPSLLVRGVAQDCHNMTQMPWSCRCRGHADAVFCSAHTSPVGVLVQTVLMTSNAPCQSHAFISLNPGGGSRLFFRNGVLEVGPESAGAHPGPVAYRKGGFLAITDANVVLGRVLPQFFPAIFGPTEDQPLDVDAARCVWWGEGGVHVD